MTNRKPREIPTSADWNEFKGTLTADLHKPKEPFRGHWYNLIRKRLEDKHHSKFSDDIAVLYISFISVWNFANKEIRHLDYGKFKKVMVAKHNRMLFEELDNKTLEGIKEEELHRYEKKIVILCGELCRTNGIEYVGATKIMHMRNPRFFVPIDRNIANYFRVNHKKVLKLDKKSFPKSYFEFLRAVKERYQPLAVRYNRDKEIKDKDGKKMTFARAVDLYNFLKAQELKDKEDK